MLFLLVPSNPGWPSFFGDDTAYHNLLSSWNHVFLSFVWMCSWNSFRWWTIPKPENFEALLLSRLDYNFFCVSTSGFFTLSSCRPLQNVKQTQTCESCQLNKRYTPYPAGGFAPNTALPSHLKAQSRSLTVLPLSTLNEFNCIQDTTDEFNVVSKTNWMSLTSYPGLIKCNLYFI